MSCGTNCSSPLSRVQSVKTSSADQNFQIKVQRKAQLLVFFHCWQIDEKHPVHEQ